ncbi:hypothetical protein QAD02_013855 [Eretmocerus hayati]|uniref:Uncharacterized protein n=1 Tax=Eretmocerus hayati TaxID=131215 RepID=A0ACC2P3L9_9HYME|nr:hypothetical protein QAD02_013855 [Eretmocerus hayati]
MAYVKPTFTKPKLGEGEPAPKIKKRTPWQPKWLELPEFKDWLMQDPDNKNYGRYCDESFSILQKSDIVKHLGTTSHKNRIRRARDLGSYREVEIQGPSFKHKVDRLEMKIALFFAENPTSIHLIKNSVPFFQSLASSLNDPLAHAKMRDDKYTKIIENVLHKEALSEVVQKLNSTHWSPLLDESTTSSGMKILAFSAQFVDPQTRKVVQLLIGLIKLAPKDCTFDGILDELKKFCHKNGILLRGLTAVGCDNASVFVGSHGGLGVLMARELQRCILE